MDTTVILAQPRVSRLRAAVVYVDSSGKVGAPPGEPVDPLFCIRTRGTAPPLIHCFVLGKHALKDRYTMVGFGSSYPLFSSGQTNLQRLLQKHEGVIPSEGLHEGAIPLEGLHQKGLSKSLRESPSTDYIPGYPG